MMLTLLLLLELSSPESPSKPKAVVTLRPEELPLKYAIPLAKQLELTIQTDKVRYVVGEPVWLRLTATNTSDHDVHCYCTLAPAMTEIYYRLIGEEPFRIMKLTPEQEFLHATTLFRLRPSEEVSTSQDGQALPALSGDFLAAFDFSKGAVPFDRPGTYEVRMVYFDRGRVEEGKLIAKPVRIDVAASDQGDAQRAYTAALAQLAHSTRNNIMVADAVVPDAAEFIHRFGKSDYAAGVRRGLLAQLRLRLFSGGVAREDASEEYRKLYESIKNSVPDQDEPTWRGR